MQNIGRLFRTLKHLRPSQFAGQIYYRIYQPKPRWNVRLSRRVPTNPFIAGISKVGKLSGPEKFCSLNTCYEFPKASDWNRKDHLFLWRYNLHYFDFLNHRGSREHEQWALKLVERWLQEHTAGIGWDPYPTSLRIVNWIRYCLEHGQLSEQAIESLAVQADHLSRQREFHIGANHLFTNGKTLLFAGCFFQGAKAAKWLMQGLKILSTEVREQFLDDGGHYERSPMYHFILLEDLLDLLNIIQVYQLNETRELEKLIRNVAERALDWLKKMTLSNQAFPLFGDSANGISPPKSSVEEYAERMGFAISANQIGSCYLPDSEFVRLEPEPDVTMFVTLDGPKPSFQPGHSHADCLSFELYVDGAPILVDSGIPTYEKSAERIESRRTAAHNTLQLGPHDSSEVWSSFRVGRRARLTDSRFDTLEDGSVSVHGVHDGYRFLAGSPIHTRSWNAAGRKFVIEDALNGSKNEFEVKIRFRAAPDLVWQNVGEANWNLVRNNETVLQIAGDPSMTYQTHESTYYPEFNKAQPIMVLVGYCQGTMPLQFRHELRVA